MCVSVECYAGERQCRQGDASLGFLDNADQDFSLSWREHKLHKSRLKSRQLRHPGRLDSQGNDTATLITLPKLHKM